MSITPNVIDPRRAAPPSEKPDAQVDPAEKLRKRVYTAFGASAGLVLLIALVYIGGRVFAGPRIELPTAATAKIAPPAPKVAKVAPAVTQLPVVPPPPILAPPPVAPPPTVVAQTIPPPKVQPPVIPAPIPQTPIGPLPPGQTWTTVTPQPGERYLQVIALAGKFVDGYVKELRAKGLHPLVAPAPADGIYRILFGPLKNQQAIDAERKDLEAAGLQPMVQPYGLGLPAPESRLPAPAQNP